MKSAGVMLLMAGLMTNWACHPAPAPPPPRVPVPSLDDARSAHRHTDESRPLPPPSYESASDQVPFDDPPLLWQRPPEQRAFVDAYRRIGSPRIILFVVGLEDADKTSIDFNAMEAILTDWIACNGQITLLAPAVAKDRLGDPRTREKLAQQLGAQVVIYVQAATTRQSPDGKDLRIVAQAINTQAGEQIGRAVVDVPPTLDKPQMNDYTRYLARKLMDDMTDSWNAMAARAAPPLPPY